MKTPRKKFHYNAIWARPGHASLGNVSFEATNDERAKVKADQLADEIGLPNTPRTLKREGQVIESLTTGRTHPR